jgi:CheY-like chemotaxis protein
MPLNRNKVVIIGDDAVSLYTIRELLIDDHLEVIQLRQGPGTLGLVKSLRPDLILLDTTMSASSGDAIRETLSQDEDTRTIPLIQCSSADGDSLRKRVRRYRTSGYPGMSDACCRGKVIANCFEGSGQ